MYKSITILLFTITLAACDGGTAGGGDTASADTTPAPFNTSKTTQIDVSDVASTTPAATQYSAFDFAFSDRADGDTLTLKGLAVFGNRQNTYNITLSRITAPTITLAFDGTGAISTVTAYLNEGVPANLSVNAERFDFASGDSEYMAFIDWEFSTAPTPQTELTDSSSSVTGMMVAGIENNFGGDILAANNKQSGVVFNGSGKGIYGVGITQYNTSFTAAATVDFMTKNISFSTSNTTCTDTDCDGITASTLDFTGLPANFATGNQNLISQTDVTLDSTLKGTLDARFYGAHGWELGGTFALADTASKRYYYGAFGTSRQGINTPLSLSQDMLAVTPPAEWATNIAASTDSDTSLSALSLSGGTATMNALAVTSNHVRKYQRSPNRGWTAADNATHYGDSQYNISLTRLLGAGTSISFADTSDPNTSGAISEVQINFTAMNFTANTFDATPTDVSATATTNATTNISVFSVFDDADSNSLTIDRAAFGFNSSYMVYVTATADRAGDYTAANQSTKEYNFDYDAVLLAGVETKIGDFAQLFGAVDFTGKGRGIKGDGTGDADSNYATNFDVNVAVNFGNNSLVVTSSKTCKAIISADCTDASLGTETSDRIDSLNFTTTALSFADADNNSLITNTASGTATAGTDITDTLTGTVDARFYGAIGAEFGGTFALANQATNSYYFGAFGANRQGIVTNYNALASFPELTAADKPDVLAQDANMVDYVSLSAAFADVNGGIGFKSYTLNGLAVYGRIDNSYTRADTQTPWETVDYTQTVTGETISNNAALAISLTENDGTIYGVTAYLRYDTVDTDHVSGTVIGTPTATNFSAPIGNSTTTNMSVSRGSDFFGFESNYMVYLGWTISKPTLDSSMEDSTYNIEGMMVAGMRMNGDLDAITVGTDTDHIRTNGIATFTGKGRGIYGDDVTSYATIFDVTATVDFAVKTMGLTIDGTCRADDATCATPLTNLDLTTAAESLVATNNYQFSSTLLAADNNGLAGNIYARLYGTYGWEFGGTFALYGEPADDNRYYYGAFGAQRNGVSDALAFNTTATAATTGFTINADSLNPITATSNSAPDTTLSINAIAAYNDDSTNYQRTQNMDWNATNDQSDNQRTITSARLTDSALSISFDASGNIQTVTAYADSTYTATADSPASATSFTATNADGVTLNLELGAALNSRFGFESQYIAYLDWQTETAGDFATTDNNHLATTIYDRDGIMLAGIATTNADLNRYAGITSFTGKGTGVYDENDSVKKDYSIATSYGTTFDVIANIDFHGNTIIINSSNTCRADDATCATPLTTLDFTTGATAIAYSNNSDITGVATADSGALTGNFDARFYNNETHELGGTFMLTNQDHIYYGAFAGQRPGALNDDDDYNLLVLQDTLTTTHANAAGLVTTTLTSFYDANRIDDKGTSNKSDDAGTFNHVLPISNAIQITNNSATTNLLSDRISGALLKFDYQPNGEFSDNDFTLYIGDNEHIVSGTGLENDFLDDGTFANDGSDTATSLDLIKSNSKIGFDAEYVANLTWLATNPDGNAIYGYGMVGFETLNANIPLAGSVIFADGKGRGRYIARDADASASFNTFFNVSSEVNFTAGNIIITGSDTCTASGNACANTLKPELDFTANLDFTATDGAGDIINHSAGTFTSNGDGIDNATSLTGNANARFYGTSTNEFGGTFTAQNNLAAYAGWFGGKRGFLIETNKVATVYAGDGGGNIAKPNGEQKKLIHLDDNNRGYLGNDINKKTGHTVIGNGVRLIKDDANQKLNITHSNDIALEWDYYTNTTGSINANNFNDADKVFYGKYNTFNYYFANTKYLIYNSNQTNPDGIGTLEEIDGYYGNIDDGVKYFGIGDNNSRKSDDVHGSIAFHMSKLFNERAISRVSRNMLWFHWNVEITGDLPIYGYAVGGYQTADGDIPSGGTDSGFEGMGRGYYADADKVENVVFVAYATVNFNDKTIELTGNETCTTVDACGGVPLNQRYHLDFKGTLSFKDNSNNAINDITGNLTTLGADLNADVTVSDGTELTGKAEAKFYGNVGAGNVAGAAGEGPEANAAFDDRGKEFGGTFRMQNNQHGTSYIGYFGLSNKIP